MMLILIILATSVLFSKSLLSSIIAMSFYSMVCAIIFLLSDAVDVALTEAAVGAGISTLLFIKTLSFVNDQVDIVSSRDIPSFMIFFILSILMVSFSFNFPEFGSISLTDQAKSTQYYLNQSMRDMGIPNVVTSILAGYRAFDTLGEVIVIFTAGISVLGILNRGKE